MTVKIVRCGEDPLDHFIDAIGGKGMHLLALYNAAKEIGTFYVPEFFIIPAFYPYGGGRFGCEFSESHLIQDALAQLKNPVIVRSSSPLEDGIKASFAGMFLSVPDVEDYQGVQQACWDIKSSALQDRIERHAEKMGVAYTSDIAFIVHEQVINPKTKGIVQLEEDKAIMEETHRDGWSNSDETDYAFLEKNGPFGPMLEPHQNIHDREYFNVVESFMKAKKLLGLQGVVQGEFCLNAGELPPLVQIRQLPATHTHAVELDMDIPEGVPYIESEICNGVAGELTLPAYVTASQAGIESLILIPTGQAIHPGAKGDERAVTFKQKSRLAKNPDILHLKLLRMQDHMMGIARQGRNEGYHSTWQSGNSFFDEYILVCDKLDESICGMNDLTTNKRAIITTLEASRTSHAMTVARELGIPAMGVKGKISDMDYFYNQVETGDVIHLKSDGKRAVAYIAKRREADPYKSLSR